MLPEDFNAIKLKLASSQEIISWSHGEVTKPETINYVLNDQKKMVYFQNEFLVLLKIGSVIAENIKELDIKELFVINVE
jgi:hypothetical protein